MIRFRRQFDKLTYKRAISPMYMNALVFVVGVGGINLGICLLGLLMLYWRGHNANTALEVCYLVGIITSLFMILAPAIHANAAVRRPRAGSARGPQALPH
jgi:hypothetical protein